MNFGMTRLDQSMETEQNFATRILIDLLFTLKPNIFLKIFPMMSRDGLIHLTDKRSLPIGRNEKVPGLFKDELGRNIMADVVALRPKTYAYLMNDGSDHKKTKGTKKVCNKTKTYI